MAPAPVASSERIETLDIVRGIALFGIMASNMRAFNAPLAAYFDHSLMWQSPPDQIAQGVIDLFISVKFITIFSFLFGIGFAIQMDRAETRGWASRTFYLRRQSALLLFGVLHSVLLWWGDILAPYALMGFALYLFRNRSQESILKWAAFLYAWPLILSLLLFAASSAGVHMGGPPKTTPAEIERLIHVYSTGSYFAILQERLKDNLFGLMGIIFYYPRILGLFLAGLWVWRNGIVRDLAGHAAMLRRCRLWGLGLGLPLNVAVVAMAAVWHPDPMKPSWQLILLNLVQSAGAPALSLFYATTIALAVQRPGWASRLRPFGAVGRTALTNYLLQTLVCTTLYNSWGFGWYGQVGPLLGLVPTFAIYGAQVVTSVWWTRRFAYGPMEWLWRTMTYGRLDRIERGASMASAT